MQSGIYSTKSGYYFLKTEVRMSSPPRNHASMQTKSLWKRIWKMAVLCKVRNFVWRARRNAIPTNSNLVCCVIEDSICSLCSQSPEDVLHFLWPCPGLTQVWEDDPQWAFRSTTRSNLFLKSSFMCWNRAVVVTFSQCLPGIYGFGRIRLGLLH